ncbi:VWA domain-containing protein [Candidatus Woesearchaeota archaeon]|nr:VWA domain-containing protein [Candidatus Woesearchaeota archaeon]
MAFHHTIQLFYVKVNNALSVKYSWILLLIIPLFFFFRWLVKKDFVKLKEEEHIVRRRLVLQNVIIATRTVMFFFILLALAAYYAEKPVEVKGDLFLKILVDNSTSMGVFKPVSENLFTELKKNINVEIAEIGKPEESNIGDALLNNLAPQESILLISDGNANSGIQLGDVVLFATTLNSTVNALKLEPDKTDVSVSIAGPEKTTEDVESTFTVVLEKTGLIDRVPLKVKIDDKVVLETVTSDLRIQVTTKLSEGFHRISAEITLTDYFEKNNKFYKTVQVVPPPRILFYTKKTNSPLIELLKQVVQVDVVMSLPDNAADLKKLLNKYYTIIINDIPAKHLNKHVNTLFEYLSDGNGMIVFGGYESYSEGLYRGSSFEQLLMPVFVGKAGRKESDTNVVLLIDISASTGAAIVEGGQKAVDIEKALALGVMKTLRPNVLVAVFAFNTRAIPITPLTRLLEKKAEVEDMISRLVDVGGTAISSGLFAANAVLDSASGSKNIIIISDGKTHDGGAWKDAAKRSAQKGIKIYTVGVGEKTNEEVMLELARIGRGIYFRANQLSRLKILFGEVEETGAEHPSLSLLDSNHFITQDLEDISATIYGYNDVVQKTSAQLLATSSSGDPLLAVWRVGLGRIAAFATDDGTVWSGDLMSKKNSKLLIRSANWAIGEPDRKNEEARTYKDSRIGVPTIIQVKSLKQPISEKYTFYKTEENTYQAAVTPVETGFLSILDGIIASNYPEEYQHLGMNPELEGVVLSTGGNVFDQDDIESILDHVKSHSKRVVTQKVIIRWPFILIALIIFLMEIFIRRYLRNV